MAQHFLSEDMLAPIFLSSPFVPREFAGTFTRGFMRFFQGDFTSATYILMPLLENSLRYVLKTHGHDVTIFDDATQTQKDLTISALFEQMRDDLDAIFTKPITTDTESVFLNRPGPHLRHDIAYGLAHDGTPYGADTLYGCWLIFRLCLLPLFPHREQLRELVHCISPRSASFGRFVGSITSWSHVALACSPLTLQETALRHLDRG